MRMEADLLEDNAWQAAKPGRQQNSRMHSMLSSHPQIHQALILSVTTRDGVCCGQSSKWSAGVLGHYLCPSLLLQLEHFHPFRLLPHHCSRRLPEQPISGCLSQLLTPGKEQCRGCTAAVAMLGCCALQDTQLDNLRLSGPGGLEVLPILEPQCNLVRWCFARFRVTHHIQKSYIHEGGVQCMEVL